MSIKGQKRSLAEAIGRDKYSKSLKGRKRRIRHDIDYKAKVKLEVLMLCGPDGGARCSWPGCTIDDPDMLSIDHVNNDGNLHRISGSKLYTLVRRVGKDNGRFQTLCHNHQWKKELLHRRAELGAKVNDLQTSIIF